MHSAALHSLVLLAAEKSKVPFYIAGGVLAAWALIVSIGLGLQRGFPTNLAGQRVLVGITAVFVSAAIATAVLTSGSPAKEGEKAASSTTPAGGAATAPGGPAPGASASPPAPGTTSGAQPPAPPAGGAKAPAATALKLSSVDAQLAYNTRQLSAKAGKVTISFSNPSPLEHDVTVAQGSKVLGATPKFVGGTRALTLTLAPGSYAFYCSVPGHRQGGMEGTLSVA